MPSYNNTSSRNAQYARVSRDRRKRGVKFCNICKTEKPLSEFKAFSAKHCDHCIESGESERVKEEKKIENQRNHSKRTKRELTPEEDIVGGIECDHCKRLVHCHSTTNMDIGRRTLIVCKRCSNMRVEFEKIYPDRADLTKNDMSWAVGEGTATVYTR